MSTTYVETLDGLDQSHKLATLVEVVDGTSARWSRPSGSATAR